MAFIRPKILRPNVRALSGVKGNVVPIRVRPSKPESPAPSGPTLSAVWAPNLNVEEIAEGDWCLTVHVPNIEVVRFVKSEASRFLAPPDIPVPDDSQSFLLHWLEEQRIWIYPDPHWTLWIVRKILIESWAKKAKGAIEESRKKQSDVPAYVSSVAQDTMLYPEDAMARAMGLTTMELRKRLEARTHGYEFKKEELYWDADERGVWVAKNVYMFDRKAAKSNIELAEAERIERRRKAAEKAKAGKQIVINRRKDVS